MGRFYGSATQAFGFPIGPGAPATVPVVRTEGQVFPTSAPPSPSGVASSPAAFAPYMIRPEVLGAPVPKGTVPGMYDPSTVTSLFPSLTSAAPSDKTPLAPQPVQPLALPSPVQQIFNSHAALQTQQALLLDQQAQVHTDVAADLQHKADAAAHAASQAASTATMDPSFNAQAAALAAAARAHDAALKAATATDKAVVVNAQADAKALQAQQAIQQAQQAQVAHAMANQQAVDAADQKAVDSLAPGQQIPQNWVSDTGGGLDPGMTLPSGVPPALAQQVAVPGFTVSPVVAAGGLGAIGFLLGGARGGFIGALLGGAATYFMGQRSSSSAQPSAPPGTVPMFQPSFEFSPYQMPDGTMITSPEGEAAYYAAHPHVN